MEPDRRHCVGARSAYPNTTLIQNAEQTVRAHRLTTTSSSSTEGWIDESRTHEKRFRSREGLSADTDSAGSSRNPPLPDVSDTHRTRLWLSAADSNLDQYSRCSIHRRHPHRAIPHRYCNQHQNITSKDDSNEFRSIGHFQPSQGDLFVQPGVRAPSCTVTPHALPT
jgi:hypothetical protein